MALDFDSQEKKRRRLLRFAKEIAETNLPRASPPTSSETPPRGTPIVGESTALEKPYFRLTDFPDARSVRPIAVLRRSLEHILAKREKGVEYLWLWEQLKSVRQDLRVQGIDNSFTVEVYETHARLALENGDFAEFNQCQTRLVELREQHLEGNWDEFRAYGILYALVKGGGGALRVALIAALDRASGRGRNDPVGHSLEVVSAVLNDDYAAFFRLYSRAPNMGALLMYILVPEMRRRALRACQVAFSGPPDTRISLREMADLLAFSSLVECRQVLEAAGAKFEKVPIKDGDSVLRYCVMLEAGSQHLRAVGDDGSDSQGSTQIDEERKPTVREDKNGKKGKKKKKKKKKSKKRSRSG